MTAFGNRLRIGVALAGLTMGLGIAHGQIVNSPHTLPNDLSTLSDASNSREPKVSPEIREHLEQARNDDRQKRLLADTNKLLALATSLKDDVDKTDKHILSVDVIRRSEEIEKLARSIRERMKQ